MSQAVLLAASAVALLSIAVVLLQGIRAAHSEYRSTVPHRTPVPRPAAGELPDGTRDVAIDMASGHKLRGWWVHRGRAAVVLVHGAVADRRSMLLEMNLLASAGFSVLSYDCPGHGESEGPANWVGEIPDALQAAVAWVAKQPEIDPARIGAVGFSSGAAVVALVAAREPRIAAAVLEGCFTDADEQARYEYRRWGAVQALPAIWTMRAVGIARGSFRPIDAVRAIAPRPLLFISGTQDQTVSPLMTQELFAAAKGPKDAWIVPDAAHGNYSSVAPAAYARRLRDFFAASLRLTIG